MPTVAFLPWATATQRIDTEEFFLLPYAEACASGLIDPEHAAAIAAILESYGHTRAVDRRSVPLVGHVSRTLTADMTAEEIAELFAFQTRLAGTSVAARSFFSHRYWNSESVSMVVQQFSIEKAGNTIITSRRRDGQTNTIIPKGTRSFQRPLHVPHCELPKDADIDLLIATEKFVASYASEAPTLQDALASFALGNNDSPDVHVGAELVHLIGALSSLVGKWKEAELVPAVMALLPAGDGSVDEPGPMAAHARVKASTKPIREVWLRDAYALRGQYAHGRVHAPPYQAIWGLRAHLLLATQIFALALRGKLVAARLYCFTEDDLVLLDALDNLCTLDPFGEVATVNCPPTRGGTDDEEEDDGFDPPNPWRKILGRYHMKRHIERITRDFYSRTSGIDGDTAADSDT